MLSGFAGEFDQLLLEGFDRIFRSGGIMRTDPLQHQRRHLEGELGITLQFSSEHFKKKRTPPAGLALHVVMPVDPDAFNFTKVNSAERIGEVALTAVLVNVSPLSVGHVLLVPEIEQVRPQVLTQEFLLCGLHLLHKSARPDFRLVFNSILGFASVNHFHFHGLYLDGCGLPGLRFPVERVARHVVAEGKVTDDGHRLTVETLAEGAWYIRGFVVSAMCRGGAQVGSHPLAADMEALASLAFQVVAELQRRDIPHNLFLARTKWPQPDKPEEDGHGSPAADATESRTEVFILPRLPDDRTRDSAGFNSAVCEISGLIVTKSQEASDELTEDAVRKIMTSDVCLGADVFNELVREVTLLAALN